MKKRKAAENYEHRIKLVRMCTLLPYVNHFIDQGSELSCQKGGITSGQYSVLLTLEAANRPLRAVDLAALLSRSNNSISRIIDRMIANGLLKRLKDQPDRRSAILAVTPKGKKMLQIATKPSWEFAIKLASCFTEQELETFTHLLRKLESQAIAELGSGNPMTEQAIERVANKYQQLLDSDR